MQNGLGIERERFLEGIEAISQSVYDFHDRFDIPAIDLEDTEEALEALRQRLALLIEESGEHAWAVNRGHLDDSIKEAIDITYIALGTVLRLADAGRSACLEVAAKNNAKTAETHGKWSPTGKVVSLSNQSG